MLALRLVDDLASVGRETFSFTEAVDRTGLSPSAAANVLRRAADLGLVERVSRGRYALRPVGLLGTSLATEDLPAAVGLVLAGVPHRIAYRSALAEHGWLTRPVRTVQVAVPRRTRRHRVGKLPLATVLERLETIDVEAVPLGGSAVSSPPRSLVDAAARPDLVDVDTLVEALVAADIGAESLVDVAARLGQMTAVRRIGSIADALDLPGLANRLPPPTGAVRTIRLEADAEAVWVDRRWHVAWQRPVEELAAVAFQ